MTSTVDLTPTPMTNEQDGTQQSISRRALLGAAAVAASSAVLGGQPPNAPAPNAQVPNAVIPAKAGTNAPADPTKAPGPPSEALGPRSPFEAPALAPTGVTTGASLTPLQALHGTITPADLHFQ